jgi:integrase/recombinase XerC
MVKSGIQKLIDRYGRKIGLEVSPHVLRHTFAKRLVDAGVPLPIVARLLGHNSIKTTAIYVEPGQEDLAKAVELLPGGGDD